MGIPLISRRHRRLSMRLGAVIAIGTITLAAGAATAAAGPAARPSAAASGWARFGHFAPSVAPVNIFVDGQLFATDIGFKDVTDYGSLPGGLHLFELKFASDPNGPVIFSLEAGVPNGGAVTIGAVTTRDGVAAHIYEDALIAPQSGRASVRFIHAVPDAAAVDVQVVNGPTLFTGVPYPTASNYVDIEPGQYDVEVRPAGSSDVLLRVSGWSIEPGVQSSIVVVKGADGNLDVVPVRDTESAAVAPPGGVQTGDGGLRATDDPGISPWTVLVLAAVLAAVTAVILARNHGPRSRSARSA